MSCAIEGCDGVARKRGWCEKHYWRWRQHGDPLIVAQPGRPAATDGRSREHRPTFLSYRSMINRCTYPSCNGWENYGGRGIQVTERWLGPDGFARFLEDLGPRPAGSTLDRIDVDGNYEPGNCRWATVREQARNRQPRSAR